MTWTLTVEVDKTTGDHYIQFPEGVLEDLGWSAGDNIHWLDNGDNSWTLNKVVDENNLS